MNLNCCPLICSVSVIVLAAGTPAGQMRHSDSAPDLVRQGLALADHDRPEEGVAVIKKAIAIAPANVIAHAAYVRVATFYLNRYDRVREEYEKLIESDPANAVYPMALALGVGAMTTAGVNRERYETVSKLSPASSWGHYAKAQLLLNEQPQLAVVEFQESLKRDPSVAEAYIGLISGQERLRRLDDAIVTAERMAAQGPLRPSGLAALWRLQISEGQGSNEAGRKLRTQLEGLSDGSRDVALLAAVRTAYIALLKDAAAGDAIERRIRQIDATWIPQRGMTTPFGPSNISGVGRHEPLAARQFMIFGKVRAVDEDLGPADRIRRLEELFLLKPGPVVARVIREKLFLAAESEKDISRTVKYGTWLLANDPTDHAVAARIALLLADRTDAENRRKAVTYGRMATDATAVFRPIRRPINMDPARFNSSVPESRQREIYRKNRALALEALGWALCQSGKCAERERLLSEAAILDRSERTLSHWAVALRTIGRADEGTRVAREADNAYAEFIKSRLVTKPAPDFHLERPSGGSVRLSELRGKVVLLNFWATWCLPCRVEMPSLVNM